MNGERVTDEIFKKLEDLDKKNKKTEIDIVMEVAVEIIETLDGKRIDVGLTAIGKSFTLIAKQAFDRVDEREEEDEKERLQAKQSLIKCIRHRAMMIALCTEGILSFYEYKWGWSAKLKRWCLNRLIEWVSR